MPEEVIWGRNDRIRKRNYLKLTNSCHVAKKVCVERDEGSLKLMLEIVSQILHCHQDVQRLVFVRPEQ